MEIGAAECFAGMIVPPGDILFSAMADIQSCFYQCAISPELSEYFCLPSITCVECKNLGFHVKPSGKQIEDSERIFLSLAVLPMGFTWAMWLIQRAHIELVRRAGVLESSIALGAWPFPSLATGSVEIPYCDNITVVGTEWSEVET